MNIELDHDEVRCEQMVDADLDNLLPGTPRTCCVCVGHDCAAAKAEIERIKHQEQLKETIPTNGRID